LQTDRDSEDRRALSRVAAGDGSALARLVERHARGLKIVATRYLGNEADAEDVVQDTFVKVWQRAASYDPARAAPVTWIYRILVNGCIDWRRKSALRAFVGLEDGAGEVEDDAPDALTAAGDRERLARVRDGIEALGERQRMAILLSAVAGLDTAAIADALGTSRGGAEQLLVRGRRALRAHLVRVESGQHKG